MTSTVSFTTTRPTPHTTHEVTNQAARLVDYDASDDRALLEGLDREGGGWGCEEVRRLGTLAGSATVQDWADTANRHDPELRTHDRLGNRIDEVEYHPAYHHLMDEAIAHGLAAAPWADDRPGAHVAYYARHLVWTHTDQGHMCPVTMTYAAVPALRHNPELASVLEPLLTSTTYDPELRPFADKAGITAGMSMTEKQGGSDVRANTTLAQPAGEPGTYRLTGHKWFTSAPMCDVFLTLAQAPGGLTCFLVPRVLPDGSRNVFRVQRLKDKLGNRSNASSEPEYDGTVAWRVGDEGRGVRTIIEMVMCTRMSVIAGSSGIMRTAFLHALHHTSHRSAFGRPLVEQPLMRNVLADLALESEAATTLTMRLAGAFDRGLRGDEGEHALNRIGTAVAKYWVSKRAVPFVGEALECLGGNGYSEESILPRLYREAPVNAVWEGSGNVNALDLLRALRREPDTGQALLAELSVSRGADARLDAAVARLARDLADPDAVELRARALIEDVAVVWQASLLVQHAPSATADAFVASRLVDGRGRCFGTLGRDTDLSAVIDRARPSGWA